MDEEASGGRVTPDAIMQLGLGFWGSKALLSAVELGLFTELAAAGPQDAEALRRRFGLHATVMGWTPPDGIWVPRWRC